MRGLAFSLAVLLPAVLDAPAKAPARNNAKGLAVYRQACAACHMADGSGVPNLQPALDGGNRVVNGDPNTLIALVLHGAAEALPADRERYANQMPTQDSLTDDEIAAVLTYVRRNFGNKASPITPRQVATARAKR